MDWIKDITAYYGDIEAFIIKTTALIGILIFSVAYIWNHFKHFNKNKLLKKDSGLVNRKPKTKRK